MKVSSVLDCLEIQDTMFGDAQVATLEMSDSPDENGCLCSCSCRGFADRASNSNTAAASMMALAPAL